MTKHKRLLPFFLLLILVNLASQHGAAEGDALDLLVKTHAHATPGRAVPHKKAIDTHAKGTTRPCRGRAPTRALLQSPPYPTSLRSAIAIEGKKLLSPRAHFARTAPWVLIADDQRSQRRLATHCIQKILEKGGISSEVIERKPVATATSSPILERLLIYTAESARDARALIARFGLPTILCTDNQMESVHDGIHLIQWLRHKKGGEMPVAFLRTSDATSTEFMLRPHPTSKRQKLRTTCIADVVDTFSFTHIKKGLSRADADALMAPLLLAQYRKHVMLHRRAIARAGR